MPLKETDNTVQNSASESNRKTRRDSMMLFNNNVDVTDGMFFFYLDTVFDFFSIYLKIYSLPFFS